MVTIGFESRKIELNPGESVLDGLLRSGVPIPYSCQIGACRTCLVRATRGRPPAAAQVDLNPDEVARTYFMSCICIPTEDLDVESL